MSLPDLILDNNFQLQWPSTTKLFIVVIERDVKQTQHEAYLISPSKLS